MKMSQFTKFLSALTATRGRQLGIVSLILILYLLIGAAVFEALEANNEAEMIAEYRQTIAEFANSSGLTAEQIRNFTDALSRLSSVSSAASGVENWSFAPSFFFALTVVTTIGYGQISPVTAGGQAFCCVFALIGIPIAGIVLVKIADIMKDRFNSLRDTILQRLPKNPVFCRATAPLYIATFGVVLFLLIPAVIFQAIEDWTYGQSLYYSFITLSTVGFGDFIAGQETTRNRALYKILIMLWIFVGLAFLTLLLEIMNDLMSKTAEKASSAVDRLKAAAADGSEDGPVAMDTPKRTQVSTTESDMTNVDAV